MKYMKTKFLILILGLAAILRLWNLGSIPPHLTPDEASLGYNAYSILKTGKDEYGTKLPIIFKSFGDYKPGFYIYLAVPAVAALGLNEFAVRLPSALLGILSIYLLFLIVRKLFNESLALASAFVMTVMPWAIYFSRGAWEVNVALTLTLAGIYFFLKSLTRAKFVILSAIFFALTFLTYQGAKLSTGIVVLLLVLIYWKDIVKYPLKQIIFAGLCGFLVSLPIIISLFNGATGRLTVFSIFSYPRPKEYTQVFLDQGGERIGDFNYYLFHSEALNFLRGILGRWFNHFSGRFLFFEGDWSNPRHSAPYQGMLILSDLILLILGFVALVRYKGKKSAAFIWLWLILAPLPAALSRDAVHAVRALNTLVPMAVLLGFGLDALFKKGRLAKIIFGIVFLAAFIYFLDAYFVHLPKHNSKYWEYGYKQVVDTITPIQGNYKKIKVQQSFAQPYIYFLFYGGDGYSGGDGYTQGYDPAKYQKQANLIESEYKGDVGYVVKLDNIEFVPIDWSVNRGEHGVLFVADTIRIPPQDSKDENLFKIIAEIKYLDGFNTAFRILEVK